MLDTSIVIRGLLERDDGDDDTRLSVELWAGLLALQECEILIAAPTLAEIVRKRPDSAIRHMPRIDVVGFDRRAAEILGDDLPMDVLAALKAESDGATDACIKYDAMIAACAKRHRASALITINKDMANVARRLKGLVVKHPREYCGKQGVLNL